VPFCIKKIEKKIPKKLLQNLRKKSFVPIWSHYRVDNESYCPQDPKTCLVSSSIIMQVENVRQLKRKSKERDKFFIRYLACQGIGEDDTISKRYISEGKMTGQVDEREVERLRYDSLYQKYNGFLCPDMQPATTCQNIVNPSTAEKVPFLEKKRKCPKFSWWLSNINILVTSQNLVQML